jgi:hypothetical protein
MLEKAHIMNEEVITPVEFDGRFYFTNFTEQEFKSKWNSVEYTFPPLKTVPLIIPGETLEGIQEIRKKFARELATLVFYSTDKYLKHELSIEDSQAGKVPALHTENDIAPYIQRCLEPLPIAQATTKQVEKHDINLRTDGKGKRVTRVLDESESLVGDGSIVA